MQQQDLQTSIFKEGSVTYFYSSRFFPPAILRKISSLYAYVRVIDDIMDTTKYNKKQLEIFWQQTQNAWSGEAVTNSVVQDFIQLAKTHAFEWEWIEAFWSSMRQDQTKSHYDTYQELEEYMYGSAEVIGLMMARILKLPKKAEHAARLQGRAMQFVNFIRDVGEDVHLHRNYLGYSQEIANDPELWATFIRQQIDHYWQMQQEAEKGYRFIPRQYLIPIKTAADMYGWTARRIYDNPSIVWRRQLKPRPWSVMFTLLKNQWELRHHAQ
ncbi:phytoene/squalene synthase family protein [Candidatus Woesebacteria bacterium]|nr:phytoene/squalene synthase family protein [Candidatus Woesebacteria bacterium]MCD8507753.1 phytoene/squalene synthase family protein [Candidatus Woesebacteria bacterium]MCD8526643.1 phytoene/squalene synthase family protein [Candidatus Woesebacteria bacterium]MCD8545889.1 phytoene/squalene synthase family protein [Candidatus Woesebacteria bacterium]